MPPQTIQELIISTLDADNSLSLNNKRGFRTASLSGKEAYKKITALRAFLAKQGVRRNDKIIISGPSSIEWVLTYFACILSGIVVVPLDTMTDATLFRKIANQVKPKFSFLSRSLRLPSPKKKTVILEQIDDFLHDEKRIPVQHAHPEDILEIQYTSGTTGNPKGVILTHKNMFSAVESAAQTLKLRLRIRFLNVLPLSHVFSQIMGLFLPVWFGYDIYFLDTTQPRKIASFIRNKRIVAAIFVPGILIALKKHLEGKCVPCEFGIQFRLIGVGGASLDAETEEWWRRKMIFLLQGYGMTESSSLISLNAPFASRKGSAGKIAGGIDIKLGQDGEILIKGRNVTQGYLGNNQKTMESFEDGWFKTGDVGEICKGYLYIKERKKDIIVDSSGLKVYPVDIEAVLNSFKEVKESCIVEKEKTVHAVIIFFEGAHPEEIIRRANEKLMPHQQIRGFTAWGEPEFPKTPTGKVKKFLLLQKIIGEGESKKGVTSYHNQLFDAINAVLKPGRKITSGAYLTDMGMDSLKRMELISELETTFGIEISDVEIHRRTKVSDVAKILKEKRIETARFKLWPTSWICSFLRKVYKKTLMYPYISLFTKTEYIGLTNISTIISPVLFVSNHQSALDVPLIVKKMRMPLAIAADAKIVFGIGETNLFNRVTRKVLGWYAFFAYNAYPFGTTIGIDRSLEFTGEMLDRNCSVLLFPEGERTPDGRIHSFKSGAGYIVSHMNVDVIPIRIEGLYDVLPRGKFFMKRGKTKVIYGSPMKFNEKDVKRMSYNEITLALQKAVEDLE